MTMSTTGIGAGATAGAAVGMTTTSAKAGPKPTGIYVLPVGSNATLKKGLNKIQLRATTPVMKAAFKAVFTNNAFWDRVARPAIKRALAAKGLSHIYPPTISFWADSRGMMKSIPAPGYKRYEGRGYDPVTGVAFLWIVVSK